MTRQLADCSSFAVIDDDALVGITGGLDYGRLVARTAKAAAIGTAGGAVSGGTYGLVAGITAQGALPIVPGLPVVGAIGGAVGGAGIGLVTGAVAGAVRDIYQQRHGQ